MATFDMNKRGGFTVGRDSLHASDGYMRQVEALKKLRERTMNVDVEKAVDVANRLERLLPELEFSRETHVQWRDCDQGCRDANPQIGDAKFHAGAVDAYDERMAAISQAAKALRDQEALLRDIKAWDVAGALDPKRESLFALPLDLRQRITAHLGAEQ